MGRIAPVAPRHRHTNARLLLGAALAVPLAVAATNARATIYWDTNNTSTGSDSTGGTWDAGTTKNWTTSSVGTAATNTYAALGDDAVRFSAGTNATGAYNVTVSGNISVNQIGLEEGTPTFTGGTLTLGAGVSGSNVLLSVNSTVTNATINSVIAGTNGLLIGRNTTFGGTITIGNTNNSFTGGVSVASITTLKLGADGVIPDSNVVTLTGGTLDLNGHSETVAGLVSGSGSSNLALGSGTLTIAASGTRSFFGNDITGNGGIALNSGTQTLSTNYSYTGPTVINGGTLRADSLRNAGSSSSIGASTLANDAGNLVLNGGTLMWVGKTTLVSTAGNSTNRNYTLGANGGTINSSGPDAVTFSGNMTVDPSLTSGTQTFTLTGTGTGTISGTINNGAGTNQTALTKSGTGSWTLASSSNTYSGDTTISAGTLNITGSSKLGDGTGALHLSGGTLNTTANRGSTAPVANPIDLTASTAITTTSTTATVNLFLTSDSVGGSGGTLTFRNDSTSSSNTFAPRFTGSGFNFTRPIVLTNATAGGTTLLQSFNGAGTTQTFSGAISGNGSYNRSASSGTGGDAVFAGANTYTGTTTVNSGGLWVNGSHTGGDNYTVGSNGTLGGAGSITLANGKSVSASGGGTSSMAIVAPGSAAGNVGTLSIDVSGGTGGAVTLGSFSALAVDFAADAKDVLDVTGTLTVNAGATLAVNDTGAHTLGLYKVANYTARNGTGGAGAGQFDTVTGLDSSFLVRYTDSEIDLQQKAKIGAVSSPGATVIAGGVTPVSILVENASPAGSATLSFSATNLYTGLSGAGSGTAAPQTTGTGSLTYNSAGAVAGTQTLGFTVTGDPLTTQGGDVDGTTTVTVLDHSSASFDGAGTKSKTLDLGTLTVGDDGGTALSFFDIFADMATAGYTAGLDLDSVVSTGDVGTLSLSDPLTFTNLAAGGTQNYTISFDTTQAGTFSATYVFHLSDQDLAGATALGSDVVTLTVTGQVAAVPLPAAEWMGLGLLGALGAARRLRSRTAVGR